MVGCLTKCLDCLNCVGVEECSSLRECASLSNKTEIHHNPPLLCLFFCYWLDDQWFPPALISFKFSWSCLVHLSVTKVLFVWKGLRRCSTFFPSGLNFSFFPFPLLQFVSLFISQSHFFPPNLPLSFTASSSGKTYPGLTGTPDCTCLPSVYRMYDKHHILGERKSQYGRQGAVPL